MHVKLSISGLRSFYYRNGFKNLVCSYSYQQGMVLQKQQERWKFAIQLATLIQQEKALVYVDEASFNCWMYSKRTWTTYEQPVKLVLNKTRNTGITVIGAVCKLFTKPLFMLAQTTNSTDFHSFVTQIRQALPRSKATTPVHIILDNHRAHHTLVVREYCKHHNLELTFQPSYSPEFNSIETLWSIINR